MLKRLVNVYLRRPCPYTAQRVGEYYRAHSWEINKLNPREQIIVSYLRGAA